jgi:anthranilate synthase component 1
VPVAAESELRLGVSPTLEEVRGLAAEHNLVPVRMTYLEDCETPVSAFLKLRGAGPGVPARVRRAGPARRALVVHRLPPAQRVPLEPRRRRRSLRARGRGGRAPPPGAAARACRPFAGGAVGFFGYDCVRSVEPLEEPNPDTIGLPGPRADADRRARRVRPPQAHGHDPRQRRTSRRRASTRAYERARA